MSDVQIRWYGKEVFTVATAANVAAMKKAALMLQLYIKTHFTVPGMGRKTRRSGRGKSRKFHRASLPGQPPSVDTGILRSSMAHTVKKEGSGVTGEVGTDIDYIRTNSEIGTDVNYGLYLELGTVNMMPRPFLRPALKKNEAAIEAIFKAAMS